MEPARHEVQLRRRLSDPHRLPNVPPDERQGAAREEPVQELRVAHVFAARLRAAEPGRALPDHPNAQPNAGRQRRSQREDARVAAGPARALARRGQVPAARAQRPEAAARRRQAGRRRVARRAPQDVQPAERQPHGRARLQAQAARARNAQPQALLALRPQELRLATHTYVSVEQNELFLVLSII